MIRSIQSHQRLGDRVTTDEVALKISASCPSTILALLKSEHPIACSSIKLLEPNYSLAPLSLTFNFSQNNVYMASSQGKPKPSWRTHPLNPFKYRSQEPSQPVRGENLSEPLPINAVYYPNWQVYKGFPPSSLNLKCVTHIFYAFAWCVIASLSSLSHQQNI